GLSLRAGRAGLVRTLVRRGCWSGARWSGPGAVHEPVALPAQRLDRSRAERGVDLAAQVADVHLDDVVVAVVGRVPHRPQDLDLGDHLVAVTDQVLEHGVFARRDGDRFPGPGHLPSGGVDLEVARDERRVGQGGSRGRARTDWTGRQYIPPVARN